MKTKRTNKLLVLVISLMMIVTLLAGLSITASAEETGTETNTPVAEFVGQQVNLGGDISMKFYVRNNEDRPIESITVEVEFLGKLTYITECEKHPTEDKVYIYTFEGINPQCLGDLMNVTILVGGIPEGHEKAMLTGYSIEKNLNEIYDDCTEAQKQLIDDLRAYGKASEVYTGHTSMTGTNYPVREVAIPATSITTTDTADDVNLHTVNVRFGTMNYLMFKFEFASGTPTDIGDKVKIDGEAPADAYIDGNYYVVISKPISPENFHKDVSLVYDESKLTLSYSINDYCRTVVDGEYTEEMKSLAKALYNYGLSAHVVKGDHIGGTATCVEQAVCIICGNGYGNLLDHNYTYTANDDANTITESCDQGCDHSKTITLKAPENLVYDGNAKAATVDGDLEAAYEITYNGDPTNVGTYTATLTAGGVSVRLDFTITKATATVAEAPNANKLTYNKTEQALVSGGTANGGEFVYSLTENGEFTGTIPTAINAGTYKVYYKVLGDSNHNDSAVASIEVTIAQALPDFYVPGIRVTYGQTLGDYMLVGGVSVSGKWTWDDAPDTLVGNVGENLFAVTFTPEDDNYQTIHADAVVTVSALEINSADALVVALAQESFVYDGNEKQPAVTSVTLDGKTLTANTDYTVSYKDNVYVGDAKVIITFIGNYTGTIEKTFEITQDPKTTAFEGAWVTIPKTE